MVKVNSGQYSVIACDAHNSQIQSFESWDLRLWQYNALWKQYIVVVVVMSHSCKRCTITRCISCQWTTTEVTKLG